jgi:hypothetical protein
MGYVLKKITNPTSKVFNRWFAYVDHQGTLSTRGLAQHMIEHGMAGNRGDVEDFSTTKNIKGVRFRFKPDSTDLDDLTTKAFGKRVSFGNGYYQTESGPKAPKYPLNYEEEPEP